jgi:hypothetical protein
MTTEHITETEEVEVEAEAKTETGGPKQLREALERAQSEVTVLKAQKMQMVVEQLGLDITKGPGKAVADFYKGEPDTEQVSAFAQEYGWTPPEPADEGPAPAVREAQQRVTEATSGGAPPIPPSDDDDIAAAEKAGDWVSAMRLKMNKYAEWRETQNII